MTYYWYNIGLIPKGLYMNWLAPINENNKIIKKAIHNKIYWKQNKDRYKRRHITRLGNPEQDQEILKFIKNKRMGTKTPKYKALPNFVFKHNNHAFYPRYAEEIIWGEITNE